MPDLLEKLWLEVINIDSKGEWMNRSLGALHALQVYFPNCASITLKLIATCVDGEAAGSLSLAHMLQSWATREYSMGKGAEVYEQA
jgi:hypothetical protein